MVRPGQVHIVLYCLESWVKQTSVITINSFNSNINILFCCYCYYFSEVRCDLVIFGVIWLSLSDYIQLDVWRVTWLTGSDGKFDCLVISYDSYGSYGSYGFCDSYNNILSLPTSTYLVHVHVHHLFPSLRPYRHTRLLPLALAASTYDPTTITHHLYLSLSGPTLHTAVHCTPLSCPSYPTVSQCTLLCNVTYHKYLFSRTFV